jgi:transposase-like protein
MKNDVPLTLAEFHGRFATEEACEDYLARWRWPKGFVCPKCAGTQAWRIARRRLYQCSSCRHQASVTAGTALHKSKLPLKTWFWAIFLVGRHKKGISALQLKADLGLGSYESAWLLLHKIRACFDESADFPLRGVIEADETLVGAKGKGDPPGKDPGQKAIVIGAVEVRRGQGLGALRLKKIPDYTSASIAGFVRSVVDRKATLHTDAWRAYDVLEREGWKRRARASSAQPSGAAHQLDMRAIHMVFGNLKTWLRGRFHGVSRRYLPAYLDEFTYRFNRRRSPPDLFGWVMRRLATRSAVTLTDLRQAYATG